MIEVCKCGYIKKKHLDLDVLLGMKNTSKGIHLINTSCSCLNFEVDNLQSLELEEKRRG